MSFTVIMQKRKRRKFASPVRNVLRYWILSGNIVHDQKNVFYEIENMVMYKSELQYIITVKFMVSGNTLAVCS
jgi:hypothetical protein